MDRAGSAVIIPQSMRGKGRRTKYNFDNEDGREVESFKDKDLGVPTTGNTTQCTTVIFNFQHTISLIGFDVTR